jgi:iron(III) transport system substrate-binding protein
MPSIRSLVLPLVGLLLLATPVVAEEVVNVYSSRHYDADDKLYQQFTEQTGIRVNVIEGDADSLLTRIAREGDLSPADVFIAVDAGRLHKAVEAGVLATTQSDVLEEAIPASLRHPEGRWFGLSRRARVILLSPDVPENYVTTYEELAQDQLESSVLVRSSQNIYNQSLVASMLEHHDAETVADWAEGLVANFARTPRGGDRDQIRALAAGEGDVAVVNHYYFARMLAGNDADDREAAAKLRLVWPNQGSYGTHVNVSGAGIVDGAPNRENAVKFLEYLATPEAQAVWAVANYEYPVVEGVELPDVLKQWGKFKADDVNATKFGENNREAVRIMDRAGWR